MISSILAFAAGLAAKVKLAPPSKPATESKSELDWAALTIAARVEMGHAIEGQAKAEAERDELQKALAHAIDRQAILERSLADQIGMILDRERAAQDRHVAEIQRLVAMLPLNPSVFPLYPEPDRQIEAQMVMAQSQQRSELLALQRIPDPGHSHGYVPPNPFAPLPADHEWWRTHPEAAFRYFDCTCVPGRANAFRNQQAQAGD